VYTTGDTAHIDAIFKLLPHTRQHVPAALYTHTHHRFKITPPNTDQAHDKIFVNHYEEFQSSRALYSMMMDHVRSEACRSDF